MAKIKSTLEIALERAARFEMDEEETREARVKNHLDRVLDEIGFTAEAAPDLERIASSLAKVPEEIRGHVRLELLRNLFARLTLTGTDLNVMAAAAAAAGDENRDAVKRLGSKVKDSLRTKEELAAEARAGLIERLEARSVSGSAVVAPVEESDAYARGISRLTEEILEMVSAITGS